MKNVVASIALSLLSAGCGTLAGGSKPSITDPKVAAVSPSKVGRPLLTNEEAARMSRFVEESMAAAAAQGPEAAGASR